MLQKAETLLLSQFRSIVRDNSSKIMKREDTMGSIKSYRSSYLNENIFKQTYINGSH